MQPSEVVDLIRASIDDADVKVDGEGCDFRLTIISAQFDGVNRVKRQQMVYACLNSQIADGTIHAVTMQTYTPAEWQSNQ